MKKMNAIRRRLPSVARAMSQAARGVALPALACVLACALPLPAAAQDGWTPRTIRGWYRIQNGLGVTQAEGGDQRYVVQSDMVYGAPAYTAQEAQADAGSVFFVKATEVRDVYGLPAGSLRIDSLRSQGVELVGGTSDPTTGEAVISHSFLDFWNNPYKALAGPPETAVADWFDIRAKAWRDARETGYLKVARWLIEAFIYNTAVGLTTATSGYDNDSVVTDPDKKANILEITRRYNTELADALDIDAYLIPTTLSDDTTQGYQVMWRPIDWKKVTDFFNRPDNMQMFQEGLYAMDSYMSWVASAGETLEYYEIPLLMKLGYDLYDDILDPEGLTHGDYPAGWSRSRALGQPANGGGLDWSTGGTCQISYETIFTHPKLLFGWVKMALYKMIRNPYGYRRAIRHFGGDMLYNLFTDLGSDEFFLSCFCRYPYYDSRTSANSAYATPDCAVYLIDGFLSEKGTATTGADGKVTTDELLPGSAYRPLGRFGFYVRKTDSGTNAELGYYDYSAYRAYGDPLTNAYLPLQWYPATPTDYAANGGTTAAQHRRYWNRWFKNTVMQTAQEGTVPAHYVGGGLLDSEVGDGAKWVLRPVDAARPFCVVPNKKAVGLLDGHYYTSLYVDFPIDVKSCSKGMRFYTVGDEVRTGRDAGGEAYSYVDITEIKDVVPARQPVVVETTGTDAAACQVVPAAGGGGAPSASLLRGVFFNVGKTNATTTDWWNPVDPSARLQQVLAVRFDYQYDSDADRTFKTRHVVAQLNNEYGIAYDATADQLYTLQRHQVGDGDRNPMGFYPYAGIPLQKNKVFMVLPKASGAVDAKIALGGPSATDGIGEVKAGEEANGGAARAKDGIYDLAGRRVAAPVAGGVYVVGGRKVLITK